MEELDKLPLKRVELSLSKFNEVAIPHHLDLLRQHRANILKYEESGAYGRARGEQAHARRVCSQLRALLAELEALRARTRAADLPAFDRATARARDLTLRAVIDYLETSPIAANRRAAEAATDEVGSVTSTSSVGVLPPEEAQLQLRVDEDARDAAERAELLRCWTALQADVHALHDAWRGVADVALLQREQVAAVGERVELAASNAEAARGHLAAAERLRGGALALGGACAGALCGGPAGLLLGLKAGAAAALAGSLLGYLGARAALAAPAPAPRDKDE